ncbi:Arylesterase [compost metagenome]
MGHYIEVENKVKLYVEDIGTGSPVIFLHGWPLNHKMFEYQFTALSRRGFRCIGIDQRGFGKSDAPADGYSYDRLADDVRAVIDHLKLENAALVGFSVGGAIAVRYMARHAGYGIDKLVLLGAAAPLFTQREDYVIGMTKEQFNEQIEAAQTDRPKMLRAFGKIFLAHQISLLNEVSTDFTDWIHQLALEASAWGTVRTAETLRDEDLRADLAKIHVPTTIFHGSHDKICPVEFATVQHRDIANSSFILFEDSGHGMLFDEPEKFNEELLTLLVKAHSPVVVPSGYLG